MLPLTRLYLLVNSRCASSHAFPIGSLPTETAYQQKEAEALVSTFLPAGRHNRRAARHRRTFIRKRNCHRIKHSLQKRSQLVFLSESRCRSIRTQRAFARRAKHMAHVRVCSRSARLHIRRVQTQNDVPQVFEAATEPFHSRNARRFTIGLRCTVRFQAGSIERRPLSVAIMLNAFFSYEELRAAHRGHDTLIFELFVFGIQLRFGIEAEQRQQPLRTLVHHTDAVRRVAVPHGPWATTDPQAVHAREVNVVSDAERRADRIRRMRKRVAVNEEHSIR